MELLEPGESRKAQRGCSKKKWTCEEVKGLKVAKESDM